jgi:hypothetical protein
VLTETTWSTILYQNVCVQLSTYLGDCQFLTHVVVSLSHRSFSQRRKNSNFVTDEHTSSATAFMVLYNMLIFLMCILFASNSQDLAMNFSGSVKCRFIKRFIESFISFCSVQHVHHIFIPLMFVSRLDCAQKLQFVRVKFKSFTQNSV